MNYGQRPNPDIKVPHDRHELENSIRREWAAHHVMMVRGATDALDEASQLYSNVDHLLDHYPNGQPRDIWAAHLLLEGPSESRMAA